MERSHWRLIISHPAPGSWNMAVDEAIMEEVNKHNVSPTLRLYSWFPYCLSIGHAQSYLDVNEDYLNESGWGLVRRPTGGRAILHADELTYSVCAPLDDPNVRGGVIESYRHFAKCLLKALNNIGIHADSKPKTVTKNNHLSKDPVCFQYPSDYEITINGKKIIGSAQARKKNGLLQHGSIPLYGDISRIIFALNFTSDKEKTSARRELSHHAITIESAIERKPLWKEFSDAMVAAFETELGITFTATCLSNEERTRAMELQEEKYANRDWTYRI